MVEFEHRGGDLGDGERVSVLVKVLNRFVQLLSDGFYMGFLRISQGQFFSGISKDAVWLERAR